MNKHNRSSILGENNINGQPSHSPSPSTKYNHPFYQYESLSESNINNITSSNQPCKSPSPDKKRANIITPTKSPQLIEIKRNMTPLRLSQKKFQKTPVQLKPSMRSSNNKIYHQQSTKYYTNEDFQQYRSSQRKNQVLEQLENMVPQEFMLGTNNSNILNTSQRQQQMMGSRQQQQYRTTQPHISSPSLSKQLDYIKLLQEKQRTIKQLHEIIQMINRNNSLDLSASCGDDINMNILSTGFKGNSNSENNKKLFETTHGAEKLLMLSASKIQSPQHMKQKHQLKQQIRTLTIQNQQLIHMIEKLNNSQQNNNKNPSKYDKFSQSNSNSTPQQLQHQLTQSLINEQHLIHDLKQTKQHLQIKQQQIKQLLLENRQLSQRYVMLDLQNQKLIKMMKEKELSDRKYHASLMGVVGGGHGGIINSGIGNSSRMGHELQQVNNNNNTNNSKQRLSLIKIKQQYNQSLKVFKDTVCGDVQEFMAEMGRGVKILQQKMNQMQQQVIKLQKFKQLYEENNSVIESKGKSKKDIITTSNKIQNKNYVQQNQQPNQPTTKQHQIQRTHTIINDIQQLSQIQMTSPQKISTQSSSAMKINKKQQAQLITSSRQQHQDQIYKKLQIQKKLNGQYQQQLIQLKQHNDRLQQQCNTLNQVNKTYQQQLHQLNIRCAQLQTISEQTQQLKLKIQLRDSRQQQQQQQQNKRSQQIQDINMARAQQKQIQTLKEMIMRYQQQLDEQKSMLMKEIQVLVARCKQSEVVMQQKTQGFVMKEIEFKQKIRQRQLMMERIKQQLQNNIILLKQQLQQSTLKIYQLQQNLQQQNTTTQLKLSLSQQQLNRKQQQMQTLKQTLTIKQNNQSHTHEQIQKLVQNYQKQIHLLKQKIMIDEQKRHEQLQQKMTQIRRLVIEKENVQRLMGDMEGNYNQQIDRIKEMLKVKQEQLTKINKLHEVITKEYEQLMAESKQMKQHVDRLLVVADQVQQMQEYNVRLRDGLRNQKQVNDGLTATIQQKLQQIEQYKQQIQQLVNKLKLSQQTHTNQSQTLHQQITQLTNQTTQLTIQITQQQQSSTTKYNQLQQLINQKQYELTRIQNTFSVQRLQYEQLIQRLNVNVGKVKGDLQGVKGKLQSTQCQLQMYKLKYQQLVQVKEDQMIRQELNQLRNLLNSKLSSQSSTSSITSSSYDLSQILIDYQSKSQQIILLTTRIQQQTQQIIKLQQQKALLEQKINCLQKNITIYFNEIKQRKLLTDKLLLQNSRLEKQILLVKKSKIQTHRQQSQKINAKLLQMMNNIVKLQQEKDLKVKRIVNNNNKQGIALSPIRGVMRLVKEEDNSRRQQQGKQQVQSKVRVFDVMKVDGNQSYINQDDDQHQQQHQQQNLYQNQQEQQQQQQQQNQKGSQHHEQQQHKY